MSKESGLGDNLYIAGYDFSGDIGSLSRVSTPLAVQEVTGINKLAFERIGLARDGALEFGQYFNPSSGQEHERLSPLLTTDQHAAYCRGTTLGNPAAAMVAKQINYDWTRGNDGALTGTTQLQANAYGLDWGKQLTAGKRSDTSATNGTAVDFAASTSFGWVAYLQVFSFTGTSVTVTLEDSADNVSFATFTGSAFSAASAIGAQRIASASQTATVRRYVRAVTSGTFSQATFAVVFVKNKATVVAP